MELLFTSSTIRDGNMSFKWGEEYDVLHNRKQWLGSFGVIPEDCVVASLLGGAEVKVVSAADKGQMVECDALVAREMHLPLFMVTADCFPIGMFDENLGITALIHAGYKGIAGGIVLNTLEEIKKLGGDIANLNVQIGPGVSYKSYVFPKGEIAQQGLEEWKAYLHEYTGTIGVDLAGYLKNQLNKAGVSRIEFNGIDTITDANYFSHYRSKRITGEPEGRFATIALIR